MANKITKAQAIESLLPTADWTLLGDTELIWTDSEQIQPTESAINAKRVELQAAEPIRLLRIERNQKLAETDWIGLSDTALINEKSAEWKMYRQKLRDLPSGLDTVEKVNAVTWPTKPE